jgi:hypothetical protein
LYAADTRATRRFSALDCMTLRYGLEAYLCSRASWQTTSLV